MHFVSNETLTPPPPPPTVFCLPGCGFRCRVSQPSCAHTVASACVQCLASSSRRPSSSRGTSPPAAVTPKRRARALELYLLCAGPSGLRAQEQKGAFRGTRLCLWSLLTFTSLAATIEPRTQHTVSFKSGRVQRPSKARPCSLGGRGDGPELCHVASHGRRLAQPRDPLRAAHQQAAVPAAVDGDGHLSAGGRDHRAGRAERGRDTRGRQS